MTHLSQTKFTEGLTHRALCRKSGDRASHPRDARAIRMNQVPECGSHVWRKRLPSFTAPELAQKIPHVCSNKRRIRQMPLHHSAPPPHRSIGHPLFPLAAQLMRTPYLGWICQQKVEALSQTHRFIVGHSPDWAANLNTTVTGPWASSL